MRLAVSGTAGIGKTTLARSLAPLLGLDVIDEHYEPFFDQPGTFSKPINELVPIFQQVFDHKRECERQAARFITDRCPVDLFHLWMTHGLEADEAQTRRFYDQCLAQARQYDFVILPAWGSIALNQKDDSPNFQRRVMNPWTQLRNHAAIVGYCHLWIPAERLIQLPMPLSEPDQRVQFVLEQIKLRLERARASHPPATPG